jgi:hypothetical protein
MGERFDNAARQFVRAMQDEGDALDTVEVVGWLSRLIAAALACNLAPDETIEGAAEQIKMMIVEAALRLRETNDCREARKVKQH